MRRRLWLSIAAAAIGASLLAAAGFASPAKSSGSAASNAPNSTFAGAKKGGTLHINLSASDVDYIDPQLSYYVPGWALLYTTCRQLLNYPDKSGKAGTRLYADGATAFPKISRGGRVYTFTLRSGMKFSNGKPITAKNYKFAIERAANPKMASPAGPFMGDIAGWTKANTSGGRVSGVTARGNKLIIRLTAPHADFLSRVAMMFFCPMPTNTPIVAAGVNSFPGSGPYYVSSRVPGRTIVLKRNKFYRGSRPHNVNEIDVNVLTNQDTSLLQTKRGSVDYDLGQHPGTADASLARQYGINKKQYFVNPDISTNYFSMNNSHTPFAGNLALRKAVNYAIDRKALIATQGAYAGHATDQLLPPSLQGYKNANIFPNRSNLSQARSLLKGSRPHVTLFEGGSDIRKARAAALQAQLGRAGISVSVTQLATGVMYTRCGTKSEAASGAMDMCDVGWVADYPDPFDFVDVLLNGDNIHDNNNNNYAYLNNAKYNRLMNAANKLVGPKRYSTYGNLDIAISKKIVPNAYWINFNNRDFIGPKTGCWTFQPIYASPDFTLLCKK
jgi:peptide/nickel transport system substrate-binding protein